jgi:hypothetical protein
VYTLSSEVLGTHSKNIFFGNNGIVTYIPKEKSTLEVGKPLVDLVSLPLPSRKAISRTNKTNLKSLTREAFVETAYAKNESTESQPSPFQPSSTPLQYILLFAAFSALRIFRKQGKSSTIK